MTYTTPTPNTTPNNFGTVDVTLDPTMSSTLIQSKINQAGEGAVIEWAGSTHYQINSVLSFLSGQKHFTNNGRIIKCTNTSGMYAFVNLKSNAIHDVFVSDLEFWGHLNVPNIPPATAPEIVFSPWLRTTLRRCTFKGGSHRGLGVTADRQTLGIVIDTCDISFNVHAATGHDEGGFKFAEHGECGTPVGEAMLVQCCHVHDNGAVGMWWDIGSAGVACYANESDNNSRAGMRWEVSAGPVDIRDNYFHHNGGAGRVPASGGVKDGLNVTSSFTGRVLNNTFDSNDNFGISFTQDPTRSQFSTCPPLPAPGAHEGYLFDSFDVLGNVLNGNGVNSVVTSNPAINYSTTHYTEPGGGGGGGGGPVTVTEPTPEVTVGAGTTVSTASFTPPANAVLVVHVGVTDAMPGGAISGESIHDTASHTWTPIGGTPYDITNTDLYRLRAYWTLTGASPGAMTVTVDGYSQSQVAHFLQVLAFAGADLTTPIAQSRAVLNDTGTPKNPNVSLLSAPDANSMVVVYNQIRRNPPAWTEEAGWTEWADTGIAGPLGGAVWTKQADQTFTATGTSGTSWSLIYEVPAATAAAIFQTVNQVSEVDEAFSITPSVPKGLANPYIIEVDFITPLLGEPTQWTDVTAFVRDFQTRRGRQHELGKMQAGEASVVLDNRDRRFDPVAYGEGFGTGTFGGSTFGGGASSPYWPYVVPMRHMRIRSSTDLDTYDLFTGFVEDWGQKWSGPADVGMGDATSEVHLVDGFSVLNRADITSYVSEVLSDEPLSYWPMDDVVTSASIADIGSGNQPMTRSGADAANVQLGFPGPLAGGMTGSFYDGATVGAWVTGSLPEEYRLKGDVTVEAWVYMANVFDPSAMLMPAVFDQGAGRMYFYLDGTRTPGAATYDETASVNFVSATGSFAEDSWHHVAWVRQGPVMSFYIDGAFVSSSRLNLAAWGTGTLTVASIFGGLFGGPGEGSRLAHVAIYPRALSAVRIHAHSEATIGYIVAGQTVDAAIIHVLDAVGWPETLRHIGASIHTVQKHDPDPNALTELLMLAEETDGGVLFVAGNGTLTFASSDDIRENPTSLASWGDSTAELQYSDLVLRYDDEDLYSEVRATADGLTDAVANDDTAMVTYGPRTLETSGGVLEDQLQLNDRATGFLGRYKDPHIRPESMLAVDSLNGAGRIDEMYRSEIGRRVTVTRRPPGGGAPIVLDALVEGVAHSSVEQMAQIRTTLNLVPVEVTPWILGDATYSVLGATTILGW